MHEDMQGLENKIIVLLQLCALACKSINYDVPVIVCLFLMEINQSYISFT